MNSTWHNVSVGQACHVIAGQSPKGTAYNAEGRGLPFYQGKMNFGSKFLGAPTKWTTQITKEAEAGDILMSVRAPVGPINFATQTICIGRGLAAIRPSKEIDREYLYYALLFKQPEIRGNEGAVFASINKKAIEAIQIPFPSLMEQKHIVAILDEAFAGIETAIANTEKNLANARELFESYLNSVFTYKQSVWKAARLEDVTDVQSGGTPLKSNKAFWEGDIPWYSSGELNEFYTDAPKNQITKLGLEGSNAKLFPKGSLLIGMYDTAALKMSILDRDAAFNQAVAGLRPSDGIDLRFIMFAVTAIKPGILGLRRGVRQKNLSLGKIKAIRIPLPSYEVQLNTTEQLLAVQNERKRLESIAQKKLKALAELKQSLLQKAFSGELTADRVEEELESATA